MGKQTFFAGGVMNVGYDDYFRLMYIMLALMKIYA